MTERVLHVEGLSLSLPNAADRRFALKDASFQIGAGETVCVVGESGSGKSMTAHAVMGLLPPAVKVAAGSIRLAGRELLGLDERDMRRLRGCDIGMIFQEPMTSLNPLMRIGDQIGEMFEAHGALHPAARNKRALELIEEVGLPDPAHIVRVYPHQLSGGQRQRVMIAMALALEPKLLIADEPTTALDVTTQAQILRLIDRLRSEHGTAVLFITHDFGVVAEIADRIVVLQNGEICETGKTGDVLRTPSHDYTKRLIAAVPSLTPPEPRRLATATPALKIDGLSKTYRSGGFFAKGREVAAVDNVSFEILPGETLGLVGESGSGKSTVGRCCLRLIEPDGGMIRLETVEIQGMTQRMLRAHRSRIQMIFQDPYASLNPRRSVGRIIAEGPVAQGVDRSTAMLQARELLDLVGLAPAAADRYPHEFSGGQRQRIGIARALALNPKVLVADEAVSALDVSVQAQILDLIREIQNRLQVAVLFITHDLRVAAQICDRIAVMQRGRIVEMAATAELFANPAHDYTQMLLAAVPGREAFAHTHETETNHVT
ncbi:ABC transporter ATP-binding protein [Rhizobium halophilum]|uniref:ABC transporter ATP-binding protein n=1 Tax=Rhizobium halophilum TaxID=2846852 RepID=UPI001EFE91D7|nr:ABC transporter ATP-binding protein [Rhizobium halophilum]MCF6370882.1 ABC transporter ATP-binding protein [Rhizobium halophilum]